MSLNVSSLFILANRFKDPFNREPKWNAVNAKLAKATDEQLSFLLNGPLEKAEEAMSALELTDWEVKILVNVQSWLIFGKGLE